MSKELEALQDLREVKGWNDAELNKRLDIIETALKEKQEQDSIIKLIEEIIRFNILEPQVEIDTENDVFKVVSAVGMKVHREIENKERELFRNWIIKTCFPKELKALEIIKEKPVEVGWLLFCIKENKDVETYNLGKNEKEQLTQEEFEFLKEVLL